MRDFHDKVIAITGAGGGIGRALAEAFAREGARLALNDVNDADLADTRARCLALGSAAVVTSVFDVADGAAMDAFAARVRAELGPAHAIVNNAGIEGDVRRAWEADPAKVGRVLAVNLGGVLNGTRAFVPQLLERGEGAVINVSSVFGLIAPPSCSDYVASKFAVRGYTESLMVELHGTGVSVHLVHPGGIRTNIVKSPEGQEFSRRFLTTPPADLAAAVLRGVRRGHHRIVWGNRSWLGWFAGTRVPLAIRVTMLRREFERTLGRPRP